MDFNELDNETRIKFVREKVAEFVGSDRLKEAIENAEYYATRNPDIMKRRKIYAAATGEGNSLKAVAKENKFASNEKVASSFFRDITDAKVQYLAGEGADINAYSDDDSENERVKEVTSALGEQLKRTEQAALTDALIYRRGYAYLQVIDGKLKLTHIPFREVIPLYDRFGNLKSVIRYYKAQGEEYAEYHTPEMVYTFERNKKERNNSGWKFEGERYQIITVTKYGTGEVVPSGGKGWSRLPWFEMKHNNDGTSSLTPSAKSMIKCYDITVSDFANNLIDIQDVFINIKDSYGSGMDYGETLEMLRNFKVGDGVDSVTTFEVPYLARKELLNVMKADIYAALRGVDVGRISSGTLTNTAIRALYSDIDLWADLAEWHLGDWVRDIAQTVADYLAVELPQIKVTFTRRAIFDEVEKMNAVAAQKGIISDKTLLENHPLVTDAQAEMERIAAQELDPSYSAAM